jgi:lipopolysaccharide heptosyltransferase I
MTRLLVLRLSALGDVIHTIPAVVALRDANRDTRIQWVVEAPYRELVELVAGVEAIPVRMRHWGRSLIASREEIRGTLRSIRGADVSIDFQGLVKSAAFGWLSRAKTRVGFDREAIREKPALLFTNQKVAVDGSRHVVDQNVQLAGLAAPGDGGWSAFPQASGLEAFAGAIVLLPGAGKANKLWPVEHFQRLAQHIGPKALVVWGPGERERAEAVGARVAPPTMLRELASILQNAEVVVGGDTGPLHLADALGTKVVGLYGPTNPRRNGPYRQLDHCIDHFTTTKWMESISVEEVVTMLEKVRAE